MRLLRSSVAASVTALLLSSSDASACPLCNSEAGAAVRASLFGDTFLPTLLAIAAPFPVLLAIVAALHGGRRR